MIALVIWLPQLTRMHVVVPVSGGSLWTNRVAWAVTAFFDGIFGLALGLLLIPLAKAVFTPLWSAGARMLGRA